MTAAATSTSPPRAASATSARVRCRTSSSARRSPRTSRGATSASTRSPCGWPTARWRRSPGALEDLAARRAARAARRARSSTTRPGCCGWCATARGCASRSSRRRARWRVRGGRGRRARRPSAAPRLGAELRLLLSEPQPAALCGLEGLRIGAAAAAGLPRRPGPGRARAAPGARRRAGGPRGAGGLLPGRGAPASSPSASTGSSSPARERDIVVAAATRARSLAPVMGGMRPPVGAVGAAARARRPRRSRWPARSARRRPPARWLDELRGTRLAIDGDDLLAAGLSGPRGRPRARRGAWRRRSTARRRGARRSCASRSAASAGDVNCWREGWVRAAVAGVCDWSASVHFRLGPPLAPSSMPPLTFDRHNGADGPARPLPLARRPHRRRAARRRGAVLHPPRRRLRGPVRLAEPRAADRRHPARTSTRTASASPPRSGARASASSYGRQVHGTTRAARDRAARARPAGRRGGRPGDGARRRRGARVHRRLPAGAARRRRRRRGAARRLARARERDRGRGRRGAARARRGRPDHRRARARRRAAAATRSARRSTRASRPTTRGWASATSTSRRSPAAQLEAAGVATVHDVGLCTMCADPGLFFSHRRDGGVTGRQAGVVWRA